MDQCGWITPLWVMTSRKPYPSDVSDDAWALVAP